jgi:hypothetical protein
MPGVILLFAFLTVNPARRHSRAKSHCLLASERLFAELRSHLADAALSGIHALIKRIVSFGRLVRRKDVIGALTAACFPRHVSSPSLVRPNAARVASGCAPARPTDA